MPELRLLQAVRSAPCRPRTARSWGVVTRAVCLPDLKGNNSFTEELRATAQYISRRGFGILASDESNATTGKRLAQIGASTDRTSGHFTVLAADMLCRDILTLWLLLFQAKPHSV